MAPALATLGKDSLLEPQVLPKPFPAELAGGCAAGHGAGMEGLAKRSPAARAPRGWQGARGMGRELAAGTAQAGC